MAYICMIMEFHIGARKSMIFHTEMVIFNPQGFLIPFHCKKNCAILVFTEANLETKNCINLPEYDILYPLMFTKNGPIS